MRQDWDQERKMPRLHIRYKEVSKRKTRSNKGDGIIQN